MAGVHPRFGWQRTARMGPLACLLGSLACGGGSTSSSVGPTAPSATTPPTIAALQVSDAPNPAPWSSAPPTNPVCSGFANNWFFTTTLTETAGIGVTVTVTSNVVDGVTQPDITGSIAIPARGSVSVPRNFCFGSTTQHTVQSTFRGVDQNGRSVSVASGTVTLSAR